ncbi:class E sortase [Streptomyces sp. NPDC059166]|uniref:class E sortase n=1 Tax=Streptomyces sp. NPDC059166 TaxID=3346752 RepID=UPI003676F472
MTSPHPGAGQDGPYAQEAYEPDGSFAAAVEQLADPLNDPLPGRHASPWPGSAGTRSEAAPGTPQAASYGPAEPPGEWYDPEGYRRDWYGQRGPDGVPAAGTVRGTAAMPEPMTGAPTATTEASYLAPGAPAATTEVPGSAVGPSAQGSLFLPDPDPVDEALPSGRHDETVALRTADTRRAADQDPADEPHSGAEPLPTGGRAERRKAAKGRGRRRGEAPAAGGRPETAEPAAPMSRLEARRAARAAKDSPAVVASRVVGEVFITFGVLMLLFVTYQLWWTNVRADQIAGQETHKIQDDWASGERSPGVFEPGQGFAIMHIPKLDVVAPIAEGISKEKVLDRGMIGHYGEGKLKTAMPSADKGNFALAGHRNTHGEPFRYINKLKPGDPIVVETQDAYYTYEMTSILPQTSPSNVSVIDAVPAGSGFKGPGRYITLTTCTPEFTSTYRMIVWGKMVDERPRSKGKPDALVD